MYSIAEARVSAGFNLILDAIVARGGMTFNALLPLIFVKATVVRKSAFSSPPLFLHIVSNSGLKHHKFANIIL